MSKSHDRYRRLCIQQLERQPLHVVGFGHTPDDEVGLVGLEHDQQPDIGAGTRLYAGMRVLRVQMGNHLGQETAGHRRQGAHMHDRHGSVRRSHQHGGDRFQCLRYIYRIS